MFPIQNGQANITDLLILYLPLQNNMLMIVLKTKKTPLM